MGKKVVEVANKAEEVEESKVEVDTPEETVTMELLLNTSDCLVLYAYMSLTVIKSRQRNKCEISSRT